MADAVVGWVGQDGRDVAADYLTMAGHTRRSGSPSYERLCRGVAGDPDLLARLATLPRAKQQPNLLLAATRYLGGPVDDYPRFADWVRTSWDELAPVMLTHATQTNEAGRCATLLPVLARIDGPVALLEVGASAGLCLFPDRYAYRYDDGPVLGSSSVVLACATSGGVPLPGRRPDVVWRAGLDLNPLDVHDVDTVRWLEALIWPEQTRRFAVLRAAIDVVRAEPPVVRRGDLTVDLPGAAEAAPPDATLVVFHSAVLAYVDDAGRAAFRAAVEQVAAARPTMWVANESPGIVATVGSSRSARGDFVLAVDGVPAAFCGSHGQSIDWVARS